MLCQTLCARWVVIPWIRAFSLPKSLEDTLCAMLRNGVAPQGRAQSQLEVLPDRFLLVGEQVASLK